MDRETHSSPTDVLARVCPRLSPVKAGAQSRLSVTDKGHESGGDGRTLSWSAKFVINLGYYPLSVPVSFGPIPLKKAVVI